MPKDRGLGSTFLRRDAMMSMVGVVTGCLWSEVGKSVPTILNMSSCKGLAQSLHTRGGALGRGSHWVRGIGEGLTLGEGHWGGAHTG